jgi:hypothetical protein
VAWIAGALEGAVAVGGLSVIGAALYSLGVPKDSIICYEIDLRASSFLLIAHGTGEEVAKAREVIAQTSPEEVDVHSSLAPQLAGGNA